MCNPRKALLMVTLSITNALAATKLTAAPAVAEDVYAICIPLRESLNPENAKMMDPVAELLISVAAVPDPFKYKLAHEMLICADTL